MACGSLGCSAERMYTNLECAHVWVCTFVCGNSTMPTNDTIMVSCLATAAATGSRSHDISLFFVYFFILSSFCVSERHRHTFISIYMCFNTNRMGTCFIAWYDHITCRISFTCIIWINDCVPPPSSSPSPLWRNMKMHFNVIRSGLWIAFRLILLHWKRWNCTKQSAYVIKRLMRSHL